MQRVAIGVTNISFHKFLFTGLIYKYSCMPMMMQEAKKTEVQNCYGFKLQVGSVVP